MSLSKSGKDVWAVLPLKGLSDAKKRLSTILSQEERKQLVAAMAHDMLSVLSKTSLGGIIVVTNSNDIKDLVKNYPVEVISEGEEKGLSGAISQAAKTLSNRHIKSMLVIHGDIPLVQPEDIDSILDVIKPAPSVALTPCTDKNGTNVMVCTPPDVISFHYGEKSFSKHIHAALEQGIKATHILNTRLAIDIDTENDLRDLLPYLNKKNIGKRTKEFMIRANLRDRLHSENKSGAV